VLGVDPAHRGKEIGRRMDHAVLQHFRSEGAHSVRTLVNEESEDILRFFSSLGFEPSNFRPFVKSL
jgi:ribosomal protein S18 acetylase RimI-like enzyme